MKGKIDKGIIDNINRLFPWVKGFNIPDLYYSDKEPKVKTYGEIDQEEVRQELERLREEYEEKYPNGENYIYPLTGDNYKGYLVDWMFSPGRAERDPEWVRELMREVRKILARKKGSLKISAVYEPKTNRIIVYKKAFDSLFIDDNEVSMRRCIAHEVFHAIHYYLAPKTYLENSYEAEIVREALADFYSYVLCLDESSCITDGTDVAGSKEEGYNRHRFWMDYLFMDIPYPNAIFCMFRDNSVCFDGSFADCQCNGSIERLINILDISKKDMHKAYEELVPEEFRKEPSNKYNLPRKNKKIVMGTNSVNDIGFMNDSFDMIIWNFIKEFIKENQIGSLEELQGYIPENIIRFTRGRFIILESGEILSAYPQWEIVDLNGLKEFAAEYGYELFDDEECEERTVVKVRFGEKEYTYLFDPDDDQFIEEDDKVICINKNGKELIGVITKVDYLSDDEYRELCNSLNYPELSIAKRYLESSSSLFNHFHYYSGGGFIVRDPKISHIEIDMKTSKVEVYSTRQSTGKDEESVFYANPSQVKGLFEELEKANWNDGPFYKEGVMDWPTWNVELKMENGSMIKSNGDVGKGPRNGVRIQKILEDIIGDTTRTNIFGI